MYGALKIHSITRGIVFDVPPEACCVKNDIRRADSRERYAH